MKKSLIFEIIIVILFVIFLFLFVTKKNPVKHDTILSGCLDTKMKTSDIDLSKKSKQSLDISVTNKCDNDYKYFIILSVKRDSDSDELVKVKINDINKKLTDYDKNIRFNVSTGYLNSYILDENVIGPSKDKNFKLDVSSDKKIDWISEIKVVGFNA